MCNESKHCQYCRVVRVDLGAVPRDKMLNVLDILKWKRSLQYAAGVTGQFKAGMGQQTSHIV